MAKVDSHLGSLWSPRWQEEETSDWPQVNITGNYISDAGLAWEGVFLCQLEYNLPVTMKSRTWLIVRWVSRDLWCFPEWQQVAVL